MSACLSTFRGLSRVAHAGILTVQAKRNFAHLLWDEDRHRALELLQQALSSADAIAMPDRHPIKLDLLERLGGTAHGSGDYALALAWLRRVVDARATSFGDGDELTTEWAWRLFDAGLCCGDSSASTAARAHLDWMRHSADDALTKQQLVIRSDVIARSQSGAF
jgi:hypothetical protein